MDDGAFCRRPFPLHIFAKNSYGRGAGGPVSSCAAGLERNGALCYPRCVAGFYGAGPVCFQRCPAGYRDDGALCRKDAVVVAKVTYPRGAGVVMNTVPEALDGTFQTPVNTAVDLIFEHDDFDDDRVLPTTIMQQPTNGLGDLAIFCGDEGTLAFNSDWGAASLDLKLYRKDRAAWEDLRVPTSGWQRTGHA